MKAAVYDNPGPPAVLRYADVPDPTCGPDNVLVAVEAISIEGGDLINRRSTPQQSPWIVGYAAAGTVISYETFKACVEPHDRHGARYAIDSYFTDLTGITEEQINQEGKSLQMALDGLDRFSDGATFWSWEKTN